MLSKFRDWMAPCTEAPDEFIFASAYVTLGLAIGRNVYAQLGRRLYANALVGIVGPASIRKGTPWALINDEVIAPHIDPEKWELEIVRGTGSAEGLLENFMRREADKLIPVPERRVLTIEEELGYFLVKSHSQATANLREITCQLWDGVDVSPPTRARSLNVVRPFYSMLATTTQETLESRLGEDDILTGLMPRFIFFQGMPERMLPLPDPPSPLGAKSLADALEATKAHAEMLKSRGCERIELSQQARDAWTEVYPNMRGKISETTDHPAVGCMVARVETHIMKAALVYAVCAGHSMIEAEDMAHALALGEYFYITAAEVGRTQMGGEVKKVERKIFTLLEKAPDCWFSVRDLQQKLSGRVEADRFHKALKALIKLEVIECSGTEEKPVSLRLKDPVRDTASVDSTVDTPQS